MPVRTRLQPLDDWISVTVAQDLSPSGKQKAVAAFAREKLVEAQAKNKAVLGHVPPHVQFVDGRKGAALETVNPSRGTIIFEFEIVADVLTWIYQRLVERSPRRSGAYIAGHRIFADGREILPSEIPVASEYSFTNTVPYSRKIEIGKTKSGRDFVIQVEPRIYDRVSAEAARRFGNIAKISYTFRGIVGGAMVRGRAGNKSNMRYPTIVVRPT